MQEPAETAELLAFVRTVDGKSVSKAARELGVPRATISRRLGRLEEHLGVRLLQRTTRSLSLTDAGEALYGHARMVLDAVQQAEDSVRRQDDLVRGALRVSVPPLTDPSFHRLLTAFAQRYPLVDLQVHFSSQHVDLVRDGYHVALRASPTIGPGLVARTLLRVPLLAVAAPSYLARRGTPQHPRDLRMHDCLVGFARGEVPQTHWPLKNGERVAIESRFATNEIRLLCDAAADGLGIALLPLQLIVPYLEQSRLVSVLPDVVGTESRIALVYAERQFLPPQVRAFIDAVVAWSPGHLGQELIESCPDGGGSTAGSAVQRDHVGAGADR